MSEKPILLLNEKLELSKEGEDYIKSVGDKKLSIIAVIGPKSSGKSFLSNQLVGIFNNGFEIGSLQNKNECCTKGLWSWGKPITQNDNNFLILDAQGFQTDNEEQINSSQKFFNLINLISTNVVYNYKKDDESEENNEINDLVIKNSVDFFTKLIQNEDLKLDEKKIPNLFWVYRDYSINDTNKYLDVINSQLKNCENYEKYYKNKIKIFTLPSPMEENDMLINLYLDEDEDPFDEEYKKKIIEFKNIIFGESNNNNITGSELLKLINNFNNPNAKIEVTINKDEIDQISNDIINELKNKLKEKNEGNPDVIDKCKNSYDILSDKILNAFNDKYPQNEYFIEKINDIINIYGKELIENYLQNKIFTK